MAEFDQALAEKEEELESLRQKLPQELTHGGSGRGRPTAGVTAGIASGHSQAPNDDQVSRRDQKKCWNCGRAGHLSANCSKPHKESSGNCGNARANMVGTGPIESLPEDPLSYLLSDSDSDSGGVSEIRVEDKGSIPRRAAVLVGGSTLARHH